MPQTQLPVFPTGCEQINSDLAVQRKDNQVTYFNGHLPVFTHQADDLQSFRLFTTQLIVNGSVTQAQIVEAFGVPATTVKRYVKKYRLGGPKAMYEPPQRRKGSKLTPERLAQAQALLDQEWSVSAISQELDVLPSTLHKAIDCGRLKKTDKKKSRPQDPPASTQAERGVSDQAAPLGVATARTTERVMASVGLLPEAALQFQRCDDVRQGGVLCALPALLAVGLLRGTKETFSTWPKGFYAMEVFFITLAFLALARVRSVEALRYESPGEWGKLLGLDRIPEVKTLRQKIALLCQPPEASTQWSSKLAQDWMAATTENPGYYYIDGHVRVYHGDAAHRPRAYVAREELCLRATLDYWVNAMDGQPFFVVTQDLNERLIESIQQKIIGRLITDAPGQPSEEELAKDPLRHRFVIVFDREGYSPKFFKELLEQRIAVVTYAKRCKSTEDWPLEEFSQKAVQLINGQRVELSVAERGVCLSNGMWVREVRHRDDRGHQTAILSTDFIRPQEKVLAGMFARWCQENYFRYMMEHFNLDRLVQYGAEPIPETSRVVNPARRTLESKLRQERALLHRARAQLGAKHVKTGACASKIAAFEQEQGQWVEQIRCHERQLDELREQRKTVPKHVSLKEIPEADRFTKLHSVSKHFVDTIKMIAYRAETGMVGVVRQKLKREEDARSLIRQIFESSVNLIPKEEQKTLTIQIHPLSTSAHNEVLKHLCAQLTETETIYPKTELRMIFEFLGSA